MNFLAHAFLSGDDHEVLIGNFIADSVKGKTLLHYTEGVQRGILLHREIDRFTDQHIVVKEAVVELRPLFGKFSGVVLDIYFDHFLALNWKDWHDIELSDYVSAVYKILIRNFVQLPPRSKRILPFMIAQNWLTSYANYNDLDRVFKGMSRRSAFESGMEEAVKHLRYHHEQIGKSFQLFFPDLILHSEKALLLLTQKSS